MIRCKGSPRQRRQMVALEMSSKFTAKAHCRREDTDVGGGGRKLFERGGEVANGGAGGGLRTTTGVTFGMRTLFAYHDVFLNGICF